MKKSTSLAMNNRMRLIHPNLYVFFFLMVFAQLSLSQSVSLDWVNKLEATGSIGITKMQQDQSGNFLILGTFGGTCDFDLGSAVHSVNAQGVTDMFVLKLNSSGGFLWVKTFGGNSWMKGNAIKINAQGEIFITGFFDGVLWLHDASPVISMTSKGKWDGFTMKLDSSGSISWINSFGGSQLDEGVSVEFANHGGVIVTGYFRGQVDFDPSSGTSRLTASPGYSDIFIQKLDSNGNFVWVKQISGPDADWTSASCTDKNNSIYITGISEGVVDFDPGTGVSNLRGYYPYLFVLKLDSMGNFVWANKIQSGGTNHSSSIAVDNKGDVIVGGSYNLSMDFDPGAGNTTLTPIGQFDAFVWKLDNNGIFKWAKSFGGNNSERVNSLVVDDIGNIYTTGSFSDTVDFSFGAGYAIKGSNGNNDFFIQKIDSTGKLFWVETGGGALTEGSWGIFFDLNRDILHFGILGGTADFDPGTGSAILAPSFGKVAGYVRKLNQCSVSSTDTKSECVSYTWVDGNTYTSSTNSAKYYLNSSLGCDSIITLNLDLKTVNVGVTRNGFKLTANAVGASYQWNDCDANTFISGASDSVYEVNRSGSYAVVVLENGCIDTSICYTYLKVGLEEVAEPEELVLYPNPAKNELRCNLLGLVNNTEVMVLVYNNLGSEVLTKQIHTNGKMNEVIIDVSSLKKGMYYVSIQMDEEWYSSRFMKF